MPALIQSWDQTPAGNTLKAKVAEQIGLLRAWDLRWSVESVPTSLAVFWGDDIRRGPRGAAGGGGRRGGRSADESIAGAPAEELLQSLSAASDKLQADFGSWKTPWGETNRFQRLTGDLVQPFHDARPSLPVGFTYSH